MSWIETARLAVKEIKKRGVKQGIASLCVGGGQGGALWIHTA